MSTLRCLLRRGWAWLRSMWENKADRTRPPSPLLYDLHTLNESLARCHPLQACARLIREGTCLCELAKDSVHEHAASLLASNLRLHLQVINADNPPPLALLIVQRF